MDAGSIVVVLALLMLLAGLALMKRGSQGAEQEPADYDEDEELD